MPHRISSKKKKKKKNGSRRYSRIASSSVAPERPLSIALISAACQRKSKKGQIIPVKSKHSCGGYVGIGWEWGGNGNWVGIEREWE